MKTDPTEKGLETLIHQAMTGRTRLVADVVTGKLDERAAARRLSEEGGELLESSDESDSSDSSDESPLD